MNKTRQLFFVIIVIVIGIYLVSKFYKPLSKKANKIKSKQTKSTSSTLDLEEEKTERKTIKAKRRINLKRR